MTELVPVVHYCAVLSVVAPPRRASFVLFPGRYGERVPWPTHFRQLLHDARSSATTAASSYGRKAARAGEEASCRVIATLKKGSEKLLNTFFVFAENFRGQCVLFLLSRRLQSRCGQEHCHFSHPRKACAFRSTIIGVGSLQKRKPAWLILPCSSAGAEVPLAQSSAHKNCEAVCTAA